MNIQDSQRGKIPIAVVGFNHRTADVKLREKAAFSEKQQIAVINHLSKNYKTRSVIVLSTCNRTEVYFCGRKAIKFINDIRTYLDSFNKENIFSNKNITYQKIGQDAVYHFFRVIASLDSQMIGEPQITGQVKEAYQKSHQMDRTDILCNKMFNFGMQVEKQIRSKTYLTDGAVSISYAGVELARKIFGNLQQSSVLLIGAGDTAKLAAMHFSDRKVSQIFVANRTLKKARNLASKFNGKPIEMEQLADVLFQVDIVITATSSTEFVINKSILEKVAKARDYKPLFIIDLAIPRDVDPDVKEIDGIFLYNMDALEEIVLQNLNKREKEIPKAEKIVEEHLKEFTHWYETLPVVKTIKQLNQYFEEIREREFERLKNRFPKESLQEAEYLSKSLMKKYLHHHIITLRRNNEDPKRQKQHIDLVGEIYQLNGSEYKDDKKN